MAATEADKAMEYGMNRFLADGAHYRDLVDIRAALPGWDAWPETWSKWAEDTEQRGDEARTRGDDLTAAVEYHRSALYFHIGQYLLYDDIDLKKRVHDRKIAVFTKALPLFDTPVERVEIPYDGHALAAYFRAPKNADRAPCVVLLGGLDTTKEDYQVVSDLCISRGLATIAFDGPGQGETFFEMALTPDFERSVSAVIDYVEKRPEVDASRIGLVGRSLGGYWAPKAAALDDRIKALFCWAVGYDFENFDELPQAHNATYVGFKAVTKLGDKEARDFFLNLSLKPYASKLKCPTLLCHGGLDRVMPIVNVDKIVKDLTCPVEKLVWQDSGHCCHDRSHIMRPAIADFFRHHL